MFIMCSDNIHGVGHNKSYEQILVPLENCKMGEWIEVRVTAVTKFSMISKPVANDPPTSLFESVNVSFFLPMAMFILSLIALYCIDNYFAPGFLEEYLPFLHAHEPDTIGDEFWTVETKEGIFHYE